MRLPILLTHHSTPRSSSSSPVPHCDYDVLRRNVGSTSIRDDLPEQPLACRRVLRVWDPNYSLPGLITWNMTVQHKFLGHYHVPVGYVRSTGKQLMVPLDIRAPNCFCERVLSGPLHRPSPSSRRNPALRATCQITAGTQSKRNLSTTH